ncbi:hypothetical protein ACWC9H_27335 [Streptomyces sp. NPDC001251]
MSPQLPDPALSQFLGGDYLASKIRVRLNGAGIHSVDQLCGASMRTLLDIHGLGRGSLLRIASTLDPRDRTGRPVTPADPSTPRAGAQACAAAVRVAPHLRQFAYSYSAPAVPGADTVPERAVCQLDPHPHGDHVALLRDLDPTHAEGALWIEWPPDQSEARTRHRPYCRTPSPTRSDICHHPAHHRGGCTWERTE